MNYSLGSILLHTLWCLQALVPGHLDFRRSQSIWTRQSATCAGFIACNALRSFQSVRVQEQNLTLLPLNVQSADVERTGKKTKRITCLAGTLSSAHGGLMIGPAPGCAPTRALADLGLPAGKEKAGLVAARALLGRRAAGICDA